LHYLEYQHDTIGGTRQADTKHKIEELIDQVDKS